MTGFFFMLLVTAWLVLDALITLLVAVAYCLVMFVRGVIDGVREERHGR